VTEASAEYNFDGIVGPTHNFAGLSPGNVASTESEGSVSSPRAAALEGLGKMRALYDLGVPGGVLPPQPRPSLRTLRALGFHGTDAEIVTKAAAVEPLLLRKVSSASSMWAANAATVAPSSDTEDGKLHLVPANLTTMFHRAIEATTTRDVLKRIFSNADRFVVHEPLPGDAFSDEGAANHTRLETSKGRAHMLAWGRLAFGSGHGASPHGSSQGNAPAKYPARQTREASAAVARLLRLSENDCLFPQQDPNGIDGGAFHTDVLAVGHRHLLLAHELAFVDIESLERGLRARLGNELRIVMAKNAELPVADAVAAYPFNSQVVTLPSGALAIIAPKESEANPRARAFLERVVSEGHVEKVVYLDVRQSMKNGGGPACLRLRVSLSASEAKALGARVLFSPELEAILHDWIVRRYRDRLVPADLADPKLAVESFEAMDELTRILELGNVFDFQR